LQKALHLSGEELQLAQFLFLLLLVHSVALSVPTQPGTPQDPRTSSVWGARLCQAFRRLGLSGRASLRFFGTAVQVQAVLGKCGPPWAAKWEVLGDVNEDGQEQAFDGALRPRLHVC